MSVHERPECLAFGDFVLQRSQEQALRADGGELALTSPLLKALLRFVDHPDTLLDKDCLMAALRPGPVVEEKQPQPDHQQLEARLGRRAGWQPLHPDRGAA